MYASDNKGWWPIAVRQCSTTDTYTLYDFTFTNTSGPYWTDFLRKYVTKTKQGISSTTDQEAAESRKNVLWGCPEWAGYESTTLGGVNRVQTGFGMNPWPSRSE